MPDVWTKDPPLLRKVLSEAGFTCGTPARIIKDRDAAWTCAITKPGWMADVYIHDARDLLANPLVLSLCGLVFAASLALGYFSRKILSEKGRRGL